MCLVAKWSSGGTLGTPLSNSDSKWKNLAAIAWERYGHQRLKLLTDDALRHPDQLNAIWEWGESRIGCRERWWVSTVASSPAAAAGTILYATETLRNFPRWWWTLSTKEVTEKHDGQMEVDPDPPFNPRHALVLGVVAGEAHGRELDLQGRKLPHLMTIWCWTEKAQAPCLDLGHLWRAILVSDFPVAHGSKLLSLPNCPSLTPPHWLLTKAFLNQLPAAQTSSQSSFPVIQAHYLLSHPFTPLFFLFLSPLSSPFPLCIGWPYILVCWGQYHFTTTNLIIHLASISFNS